MDEHHEEEHSPHIGPDAHLPDPSIWPLVVGIASLLLGAALIWWSRDSDSAFAGPFLGAAIVATLVAAGGWAYEDGRMKRKAEEGHHEGPRNARYTQVITFSIAEGQYAAATADDGVIERIDDSDNELRDLAGFQDLRIIASPSETGPSQVLVETTWADREGLATYDETRQTVLDILNEFPEQVVPGSVQVFDMVVVRDTKDVTVRFATGTAATLVGSLAIGGLLVGAGLTMFEGEGGGGEATNGGNGAPSGFADTAVIVGENIEFDPNEITLPPNTEVTLTFDNRDNGTPHNIRFFASDTVGGDLLTGCSDGCATGQAPGEPTENVETAIETGPATQEFTFTTPAAGTYAFDCAVHPDMTGTLVVEEGAPVPGGGAGGGGGDGGNGDGGGEPSGDGFAQTGTLIARDITFTETDITLPPETEVTMRLDNQDENIPHNIQVFSGDSQGGDLLTGCTSGCQDGEVATPIEQGLVVQEFMWTTPTEGTYAFDCVVHPNQMMGTITIEEGAPLPGQ